MQKRIEISLQTIVYTLAILAGIWLVLQIRDILLLLFIAFLLMTAIHPLVTGLERFRIPRAVSILLVYIVVLGFLGVSLASAIPVLVVQSTKLFQTLPGLVTKILPYWNIDISTFTQQIAPISENVLKVTVGIFSNIFTTMTVLVFTFYFLLERRHAEHILSDLFGEAIGTEVTDGLRLVERRLGAWVRGELILMSFVGVVTYIGLTLLHVDFALPLAIIAGTLEIVPMVGPNISAIPAILVGLSVSPFLALSVAILYFGIQQTENNIIVPLVMRKSIGFSPLITILSLLIGARLAGIAGAILAVPVVLVLQVVLGIFLNKSAGIDPKLPTKNLSK